MSNIMKNRWIEAGMLAGVTLAALLLRMWRLADESPWWDEVASLQYLNAPSLIEFLRAERHADPAMTPFYFTLQYFWAHFFGASPYTVRLLSVSLGTLTVPLIYLLGKRLFSSTAGFAAAALLSLSLSHIYFSQEIRVYALVICLAVLSFYFLVRATEQPQKWGWWALYALANLLLAFTHLFAVFLFAVQALYLLAVCWRRPRIWLTSIAYHVIVLALLGLWLMSTNMATIESETSWIHNPGFRETAMLFVIMAGGRATNENPAAHLPSGLSTDLAIAVLLATLAVTAVIRHARANANGKSILLATLWLTVPPALLLLISYTVWPSFVYRYVLYIAPALYLLAGAGYAGIPQAWPRAIFAIIMLMFFANQLSGLSSGPFRPDWRGVSDYLAQHARPDDAIVAFQDINAVALKFNSSIPADRITTADVWSAVAPPAAAAHARGQNAWLVLWLWTDPKNIECDLAAQGLKFSHVDFNGWPGLRVYEVPSK
jgi:uncharacterized membrane protein